MQESWFSCGSQDAFFPSVSSGGLSWAKVDGRLRPSVADKVPPGVCSVAFG